MITGVEMEMGEGCPGTGGELLIFDIHALLSRKPAELARELVGCVSSLHG